MNLLEIVWLRPRHAFQEIGNEEEGCDWKDNNQDAEREEVKFSSDALLSGNVGVVTEVQDAACHLLDLADSFEGNDCREEDVSGISSTE